MFSKLFIFIIKIYQKVLSPDHSFWVKALNKPPYCKHIPTCSDYAIEAFEKKPFFTAFFMMIKRILSCNPFSKWWYDPVCKDKEK